MVEIHHVCSCSASGRTFCSRLHILAKLGGHWFTEVRSLSKSTQKSAPWSSLHGGAPSGFYRCELSTLSSYVTMLSDVDLRSLQQNLKF
jgi:hypothetical protein